MLRLLMLLALGANLSAQVSWREISLPVEGDVLSLDVVEFGEQRRELVLAVWNRELRRRELRLHSVDRQGVDSEPHLTINVLDDIVAWGVAELDPDSPGRELLLLTPNTVWSYVASEGGYAKNATKLFEFDLLYDLPDRESLPRWPYVIEAAGGDQLLLPSASGFSSFAQHETVDGRTWRASGQFSVATTTESSSDDATISIGTEGVEVRGGPATRVDLGREISSFLPLLLAERTFRSPAVVDIDADGRLDLLQRVGSELLTHRFRDAGYLAQPDLRQKLPSSLREKDVDRDLLFRDIDADGDADLIALLEGESTGVLGGNSELSVLIFVNDGTGKLPSKPNQVLRFEGVRISASLLDVDDDDVLDLLIDTFAAPDLAELTSPDEIEATLRMLVFRGRGKGRFARDPLFSYEQSYDTESIQDAVLQRSLEHDCTGDGIPDLVTSDLSGRIGIRPVSLESSFFGGDSWEVASSPSVRHQTVGVPREMRVADLNEDGVADILTTHPGRVTIFLTERRR